MTTTKASSTRGRGLAWLGFPLVAVAFVSYFTFFVRFAITRDFPWLNLILLGVGLYLSWRAFHQSWTSKGLRMKVWRGALFGSSVVLSGLFLAEIFYLSYHVPPETEVTKQLTKPTEFSLRDHKWRNVRLSEFKGRRLIITFNRGHWCPFCQSELRGLQARLEDFKTLRTDIIAICVDHPDDNAEVVAKLGLEFPILSDPDLKVIDAFGVRHRDGLMGSDIARPAVFVLNENGEIIWKNLTNNYRSRVSPSTLIDVIGESR